MRDLKFKAWDKVNQRMCQVLSLEYWDPEPGAEFVLGGCYLVPECRRFRNIEELELLQYTGIKDSKGSEVYIGDIVKGTYTAYQGYAMPRQVIEEVCEVKYDEDMQLEPLHERAGDYDELWMNIATFEVIGNIYEHPHLINRHNEE